MGLGRQFAQRHFGTFQRLALGAEGRITQTGSAIFTVGKIATRETISSSVTCSRLTPIPRSPIAASGNSAFCLFLTRTVIATHRHHRFNRLGHRHRGRGLSGDHRLNTLAAVSGIFCRLGVTFAGFCLIGCFIRNALCRFGQ